LVGQEIFTKILLLPIYDVINRWSPSHEKDRIKIHYVATFY